MGRVCSSIFEIVFWLNLISGGLFRLLRRMYKLKIRSCEYRDVKNAITLIIESFILIIIPIRNERHTPTRSTFCQRTRVWKADSERGRRVWVPYFFPLRTKPRPIGELY